MGAYDCDCINNLEYDRRERKQKEQSQSTAQSTAQSTNLVDRQAAIDALAKQMPTPYTPDGSHPADEQIFQAQEVYADCITTLESLPTIQSEPSIPLSWIEGQIERLNNTDNYFAELTANIIKTMLNEWKKGEQK